MKAPSITSPKKQIPSSIKIFLATWMAVFLALPSCPCQLFESLGMDFPHKHEVGTSSEGNLNYNGISEWQAPSEGRDREFPVCHCEEGIGKTAEQCSDYALNLSLQFASTIDQDESHHFLTLIVTSASARAPPPKMFANYWLNSARTGVYRL
jgi:hypothetical protein